MEFVVFCVYLVATALVLAGAWVPSIMAIKIYLFVVTVLTLINLGSNIN